MSSEPFATSAPLEPKLYFANERTFLHWYAYSRAPCPVPLRQRCAHVRRHRAENLPSQLRGSTGGHGRCMRARRRGDTAHRDRGRFRRVPTPRLPRTDLPSPFALRRLHACLTLASVGMVRACRAVTLYVSNATIGGVLQRRLAEINNGRRQRRVRLTCVGTGRTSSYARALFVHRG